MTRVFFRFAIVVGFLGGILYFFLRPGTEQPVHEVKQGASPSQAPQAQQAAASADDQRKVRELEEKLRAERDVANRALGTLAKIDAEAHSRRDPKAPPGADAPMLFNNSRPDSFQPARFREIAAEVSKTCSMKLEVLEFDCSEYPCIAWMKATDSSVTRFSMDDCSPWSKAYGSLTMLVGAGRTKEGRPVLGWMPVPVDPQERKIALYRADERAKETIASKYGFPEVEEQAPSPVPSGG